MLPDAGLDDTPKLARKAALHDRPPPKGLPNPKQTDIRPNETSTGDPVFLNNMKFRVGLASQFRAMRGPVGATGDADEQRFKRRQSLAGVPPFGATPGHGDCSILHILTALDGWLQSNPRRLHHARDRPNAIAVLIACWARSLTAESLELTFEGAYRPLFSAR
jgi:hypothetical protein